MRLNSTSSNASRAGLSLVELMVALAVASIVFAAVGSLTMFTSRSFVAMGNYNDLDRVSRNALDRLSREIRMTRALTAYAANKLTFQDHDGATLVYEFNPGTARLVRTKAGVSEILLTQCDLLNFNISQRNPTNGFLFHKVSNGNLATTKLIDVSWRCSRKILGQKVNTESVQTAKIVMRN
jgi:prepilin-type N-terminal cleavage/methylation domain-containing protein